MIPKAFAREQLATRGFQLAIALGHVMTDAHTLMSDEELEMLVVLRMNRKFMEYMRSTFGQKLSKQPFGMTLVE